MIQFHVNFATNWRHYTKWLGRFGSVIFCIFVFILVIIRIFTSTPCNAMQPLIPRHRNIFCCVSFAGIAGIAGIPDLSFLVRYCIIQACTAMRALFRDKIAIIGQNFALSVKKSTQPPAVAVVTNISFVHLVYPFAKTLIADF